MASVLVVEDDQFVRSALIRHLTDAAHTVRSVGTALEALREVAHFRFDVVILDLGLPDLDGSEALKMLRGITDVPVIIATARDDETEIVRLLNAGADDYLTKPFSFAELLARVHALQRRSRGGEVQAQQAILRCGNLELDRLTRQVRRGSRRIVMQPREFRLLEYLMLHSGEVVTRTMLLEAVWDYHFDPGTNVIDVHISRLRRKIDDGEAQALLHTVRGAGYRLAAD